MNTRLPLETATGAPNMADSRVAPGQDGENVWKSWVWRRQNTDAESSSRYYHVNYAIKCHVIIIMKRKKKKRRGRGREGRMKLPSESIRAVLIRVVN